MVRVNTDCDGPPRAAGREQHNRATLGCAAVFGFMLPVAVILWALAVRLTLGRW